MLINGKNVKEIPIKSQEIAFDKDKKVTIYADKDGKHVKKIQLQSSEYQWLYEDGTEYTGKAYKCIKGKPIKEFSKTSNIEKSKVIDISEIKFFVCNELTYLLVGNDFKEDMKKLEIEGKALSFKYCVRGFKVYNAVATYDKELDKVILRCYRGDIRMCDLSENEEVKEFNEDNVNTLDIDSL